MRRDKVLQVLRTHTSDLRALNVKSLALFGSVARDQANESSDVDLIVEFARPIGLFEFVHVKHYLEKLLGLSVDLVTPDALRPDMKDQILREAISVAEGLDAPLATPTPLTRKNA